MILKKPKTTSDRFWAPVSHLLYRIKRIGQLRSAFTSRSTKRAPGVSDLKGPPSECKYFSTIKNHF